MAEPEERSRGDQGDWRPRPDPTVLTTEALHREVTNLREVIDGKLVVVHGMIDIHVAELKDVIGEEHRFFGAVLEERDRRYGEQLQASQRAVEAAFDAAEKAVSAALEAREKAIAAAFESAEKAILKAEVSIEKRADATYVALAELQRMLGGLMPRNEAEGRFAAAADTLNEMRKTYDTALALLADRVKGLEAVKQGQYEQRNETQQIVPWIAAVIAVVGVLVSIAAVVALFLTTKH